MNLLQKIALIECYIHVVKNKEVQISLPKNKKELELLNRAYSIATKFFKAHNAIIVTLV